MASEDGALVAERAAARTLNKDAETALDPTNPMHNGPIAALEGKRLGKRFRTAVRLMLNDEQIQTLLRARVINELTNVWEPKITPVLLKIAGTQYIRLPNRDPGPRLMIPPQIHLHLEKLSDDELLAFAERGVKPKSLPANLIDSAPAEAADDEED